jgi:hypothetical protein
MGEQDVLVVLFGFKVTLTSVITAVGGFLTVSLGAYKLFDYWRTRERRRLDMLREYLDREEKNITGRRSAVLNSIRLSEHAYLAEKKLDVGVEIDRAIDLLDRGYPQTATAKLQELEQRLLKDEDMLRRRADDLRRHTRSVRIFLGALAGREHDPEGGLDYIDKVLRDDASDLDALKYKALLLLNKDELDNAERAFERLRMRANGQDKASYRADAHLGVAKVKFARGPENFNVAFAVHRQRPHQHFSGAFQGAGPLHLFGDLRVAGQNLRIHRLAGHRHRQGGRELQEGAGGLEPHSEKAKRSEEEDQGHRGQDGRITEFCFTLIAERA